MKIESVDYTEEDFNAVIGGYFDRERQEIVTRLRRVAQDVEALAPSLPQGGSEDAPEWNAVETLAHIAVSAQFFGWVISEVIKGHEVGAQMSELMRLRDPTIVESVKQEPAELVAQLREGLERTIRLVERVDIEDLRKSITFAGRKLQASDFARVSLVHHLEDHVEQIRTALGTT